MSAYLLNHVVVEGPQAVNTAMIVHGIMGSHRNWKSFARRLTDLYPRWRFILPDLRNHGASTGAPPPHDLKACANDLSTLIAHVGHRVRVMIGHSFGGKVVLAHAQQTQEPVEALWVLDSPPGETATRGGQDGDVEHVIRAVQDFPVPTPNRQALMQYLADRGFSDTLARWMTTNLRRTPDGFDWTFATRELLPMLAAYREVDLWPFIEHAPLNQSIHIVRAADSDRWTTEDLGRLDELFPAHAHVLPDAGHWLHVDNPEALAQLLALSLGGS